MIRIWTAKIINHWEGRQIQELIIVKIKKPTSKRPVCKIHYLYILTKLNAKIGLDPMQSG